MSTVQEVLEEIAKYDFTHKNIKTFNNRKRICMVISKHHLKRGQGGKIITTDGPIRAAAALFLSLNNCTSVRRPISVRVD